MTATAPGQSAQLLDDVVPVLGRLRISYVVIGAMAASFYGAVRSSLDADVALALQRTDPKLSALVERLKILGTAVTRRAGDSRDPIAELISVEDRHRNRVDLLIGIRGMDPAAFSRAVHSSVEGHRLAIVGLEDFIAMKVAAGGPKDVADVRGVLTVSRKQLNLKLLRLLTARYGTSTLKTLDALLTND